MSYNTYSTYKFPPKKRIGKSMWDIIKELYADPKWDVTRKKVYNRDNYTCSECGETNKIVHCHHIIPAKDLRFTDFYNMDNLTTLCEDCHNYAHGRVLKCHSESRYNNYEYHNDKNIEELTRKFFEKYDDTRDTKREDTQPILEDKPTQKEENKDTLEECIEFNKKKADISDPNRENIYKKPVYKKSVRPIPEDIITYNPESISEYVEKEEDILKEYNENMERYYKRSKGFNEPIFEVILFFIVSIIMYFLFVTFF